MIKFGKDHDATVTELLKKIQNVKCPLCLDVLENPRELPCKHVFCANCWATYKEGKSCLACPVCKTVVLKRQFLKNDAALNNLSIFVKELCVKFQEQYKTDIFTYFADSRNSKNRGASPERLIIQQSSEENDIIPCTVKAVKDKKLPRKVITRKQIKLRSGSRNDRKPRKLEVEKTRVLQQKNKVVTSDNCSKLQSTKVIPKNGPIQPLKVENDVQISTKDKRILQWLYDSGNKFERCSQTQVAISQKNTPQDIDMPSVSQAILQRTNQQVSETKKDKLNHVPRRRRAHSIEDSKENDPKKLTRHSLESSSPSRSKQFQNFDQVDWVENHLMNKLDESKASIAKTCRENKANGEEIESVELIHVIEDEFLDQLDQEIVNVSDKPNPFIINSEKHEMLKVDGDKNVKSAWKSINKFKKTVGKPKALKKLNVSLQSTQKQNKKDCPLEVKLNTSEISKASSMKTRANTKTVDFQKMEDYFSKAIPELMKENIENSTSEMSQEIVKSNKSPCKAGQSPEKPSKISVNQEESPEEDQNSDKSGSDIYIYQTQPLFHGSRDVECDRIKNAIKIANELKNVLVSLRLEETPRTNHLDSLMSIMESIFQATNVWKIVRKEENLKSDIKKPSFTEKNIQTDVLSLDGFNITPSAAFKSLAYEHTATQTVKFCLDCPHLNVENEVVKTGTTNVQKCNQLANTSKENFQNGSSSQCVNIKRGSQPIRLSQNRQHVAIQDICKNTSGTTTESKIEEINTSLSKTNDNSELSDTKTFIEDRVKLCTTEIAPSTSNENCISSSNKIITGQLLSRDNSETNLSMKSSKTVVNVDSVPSQTSDIVYTIPSVKSNVNRRLMLEKALTDKTELENTLKRVRTMNSGSEEESPNKVPRNKFIESQFSIEFETENCFESSSLQPKYLQEQMEKKIMTQRFISTQKSQKPGNDNVQLAKKYEEGDGTQADTLLNYCEELIKNANEQVADNDKSFKRQEIINSFSQRLSDKNENTMIEKVVVKSAAKINNKEESRPNKDELVTQDDLLRHFDDLIEKANKQIGEENDEVNIIKPSAKVRYGYSQIPSTSKQWELSEDSSQDANKTNNVKSQDLLDHYNALIAKTNRDMDREEIQLQQSFGKNKSESQIDEFLCANLDRLDKVISVSNEEEEEEGRMMAAKLSESLFEIAREKDLIEHSRKVETISNSFAKRRISDSSIEHTPKKLKILQNVEVVASTDAEKPKVDEFNSSDDEMFSDMDVIETTPQKLKNSTLPNKLNYSQALNQKIVEIVDSIDDAPLIGIVPPPPGFGDREEIIDLATPLEDFSPPATQRESENVIPTSLTPKNFHSSANRKLMGVKNMETSLDIPPLSQEFMKLSPICQEKTGTLSSIDLIRQSKFSPLTMVPKASPPLSALMSTPKQKSILNYVRPTMRLSQTQSLDKGISQPRELEVPKPKPCIAYTRLDSAEVSKIHSLCSKNLCSRRDKFGPEVTHMIVSVNKNNCVRDHTIKFIYAIASGLWVLNAKWIQECLEQNRIVDEENYEVSDISGIPSPRIARLSRSTNPLLQDFKFYLCGPFYQTDMNDIEAIIKLLSGVVVSSVDDFQNRGCYTCMVISDESNSQLLTTFEHWLEKYKVITVDINWFILSVARYKIQSVKNHLLCQDEAIDGLGYPSQLLVDVPPSISQDLTCG